MGGATMALLLLSIIFSAFHENEAGILTSNGRYFRPTDPRCYVYYGREKREDAPVKSLYWRYSENVDRCLEYYTVHLAYNRGFSTFNECERVCRNIYHSEAASNNQ